jgi:hypothetical protein
MGAYFALQRRQQHPWVVGGRRRPVYVHRSMHQNGTWNTSRNSHCILRRSMIQQHVHCRSVRPYLGLQGRQQHSWAFGGRRRQLHRVPARVLIALRQPLLLQKFNTRTCTKPHKACRMGCGQRFCDFELQARGCLRAYLSHCVSRFSCKSHMGRTRCRHIKTWWSVINFCACISGMW